MRKSRRITVIKPEYVYLKLKPNNSIRNNDTHLIAKTISSLYRGLWTCLKLEEEKTIRFLKRELNIGTRYSFTKTGKIGYYIYMEKERIEFYFILPSTVLDIIKERLSGVWNGITMEEVAEIPTFKEDAFKFQMVYEKENALSLKTNRSDNALLNASLNVIDLMEDGDKAGILYNFIPIPQGSFVHSYNSTMEKIKTGQPTERDKTGALYLLKKGLALIDSLVQNITEVIAGKNEKKSEESFLENIIDRLNGGKEVSESTQKKIRGHVIDTQILIFSESKERIKARSYATSIAQSFEVLTGDNRLVKKTYRGKLNLEAKQLSGVAVNRIGDQEIQSFISLPGRELIEKYPFMDKVETQETKIPKDLQKGTKCIGEVTYRGLKQKAYLSDDEQYKKLMLLLIGPSRAGKSNFIAHLSIDAIENNECVIIFDFIKKCELSRDIMACFPKEKSLVIACDDYETLQGVGYNEVGPHDDPIIHYRNAKDQTNNITTLINALNDQNDTSKLTAKMERYLQAACLVVFVSGGSFKDVIGTLTNHHTRRAFIKKIPANQNENLEEYIDSLRELNEVDKNGAIIGTKVPSGIIDRINALKRNTYMELMLKRGIENNFNLVDEMQKNQVIVIKMPSKMFTTDDEKDVFTTYWMTKIWLALQVRADLYDEKDLKLVNIVVDEISQVEHTEKFFASKITEIAKFGGKPIISCHYLNQIKYLRNRLRGANASYMLVEGCDEENYKELKNELYPFTAEDLANLKRYHSMNYIKGSNGYARFITELPPKIDKRIAAKNKKAPPGAVVKITSDGVTIENDQKETVLLLNE